MLQYNSVHLKLFQMDGVARCTSGRCGIWIGSVAVYSFIPSPSSNELVLGPLRLHLYGLMIALGVVAAVALGRRRWAARGGDPEDVSAMAVWAVPAGLIGARLYHVITDWPRLYSGGRWWPAAFEVWHGGLGIPGGVAAGALAGIVYVRRRGLDLPRFMDAVAPGIPLAQAIGRLGNYFNQELFGRPSTLPWAVEIDRAHRIANTPDQSYWDYATFQPTFLYELLWNLAVVGVLVWMDRSRRLRPGKIFPAYVSLYFLGRMWVEELRSDTAARIGGLRWNFLLSLIMIVVGAIWFFWGGCAARPGDEFMLPTVAPLEDDPADHAVHADDAGV